MNRRRACTGRSGRAARPDSEKVPICAVARLSRDQLRKLPESKPEMAILAGSKAAASIVDAFR